MTDKKIISITTIPGDSRSHDVLMVLAEDGTVWRGEVIANNPIELTMTNIIFLHPTKSCGAV